MSRELKFRAWGKDIKEFIYVELKNNALVQDDFWRYNSYGEWEQYTGLKDKNGKEIYEGDIVKIPRYGIYDVRYNSLMCEFDVYGGKGIKTKTGTEHPIFCVDYCKSMQVIGNIHENPELLKS